MKTLPWDFVGIPFVDGGRDERGLDCWGLVMLVSARVYGRSLKDYMVSCFACADVNKTIDEAVGLADYEAISEPRDGAIVVMRMSAHNPAFSTHCGLCIGGGEMIHTMQKTGSVIQKFNHPTLRGRIAGLYWPRCET